MMFALWPKSGSMGGLMTRASLALAIVAGCFGFSLTASSQIAPEPGGTELIAWTQMQQPQPVQNAPSKPFIEHAPDADKQTGPQSFVGTIRKSGDQYVLKTIEHGTYQLDDQPRAQKFDGKVAEVVGDLDAPHNLIRVRQIKSGD
jgi:hypothetical protein